MGLMERKIAWNRIAAALIPAFALTILWVCFSKYFRDSHHPLIIWGYHGVFPLFLGIVALIAAKKNGDMGALGLKHSKLKNNSLVLLLAICFIAIPFSINLGLGITEFNDHPAYNILLLSLGVPAAIIMALGEEMMWRGYLFSQLNKIYNLSALSLITGIFWALWHFPIIAGTHFLYSEKPIWYALPVLTIMTISLSFIYTIIRVRSGSIWPCIILHAAQNYFAYLIVKPVEVPAQPFAIYFTGDIGILYIAIIIIAAFLIHLYEIKKQTV